VNDRDTSDRESLMDIIQNLVEQSCGTDSLGISIYAESLRLLAREGRCRIVSESGRIVLVEWERGVQA